MSFLVDPHRLKAAGVTAFELDLVGAAAGGSATMSALNIGTAHPSRYIIATINALPTSGSAGTLTAVTIGGVAATKVAESHDASRNYTGIWIALVPTGTTADVVLTSTVFNLFTVKLYRVLGLISTTPVATDVGTPIALTMPAHSLAILVGHNSAINYDPNLSAGRAKFGAAYNTFEAVSLPSATGQYGMYSVHAARTSVSGLALSSSLSGAEKCVGAVFQHMGGEQLPAAPADTDWYIYDDGNGGTAMLVITERPAINGSLITDFEVNIGGAGFSSLITVNKVETFGFDTPNGWSRVFSFTDGVPTTVQLRAVNDLGAGPASAAKTVTTTSTGTWEYLDEVRGEATSTATVTINNVPIGNNNANRYVLVSIAWHAFGVSGTFNIASMTLGGVAGTRVARASASNVNWNVEVWKFNLGAVSGTTATLVLTKGGSATSPYWVYSVATYWHATDADGPTFLQAVASHASGVAATVTTTMTGDVVVAHTKATLGGTPLFVPASQPFPVLKRSQWTMIPDLWYAETIHGYRPAMSPQAIAISAFNTASQSMLATVWSA